VAEKPVPEPEPQPPPPAPEPKPEPKPEPPKEEPAAAKTPMEQATECMLAGDNPCVIKALKGKARKPNELALLIETYRSMGNTAEATGLMKQYVDKFPSARRANAYRRQLELQGD
jgi:hypothetical protein